MCLAYHDEEIVFVPVAVVFRSRQAIK